MNIVKHEVEDLGKPANGIFSQRKLIELVAAGVCIIGVSACDFGDQRQKVNIVEEKIEISFQDELTNQPANFTCLSHGAFCTDGDGIYSLYGERDGR